MCQVSLLGKVIQPLPPLPQWSHCSTGPCKQRIDHQSLQLYGTGWGCQFTCTWQHNSLTEKWGWRLQRDQQVSCSLPGWRLRENESKRDKMQDPEQRERKPGRMLSLWTRSRAAISVWWEVNAAGDTRWQRGWKGSEASSLLGQRGMHTTLYQVKAEGEGISLCS